MPVLSFARWQDVPAAEWRWPNFTPQELACRGTGALTINTDAMDRLQRLRDAIGVPLIVTSGYRSPAHNARVGGAANSMHLRGQAFDISMNNMDPEWFIREAKRQGFGGIGTYPKQGFVHVDTGPVRAWGDPFPARETRFAPEPAPRPVMATAQGVATARGVVAAAASTLAASASGLAEVAQHPVMAVAASLVPWLASAVAVAAVVAMVLALLRRRKAEGAGE
jgi:zinc D-Ala-D-Ala carboxypeptidase